MRIAIIEHRMRSYIMSTFNKHDNIEITCFAEWRPKDDSYQGIPIVSIEDIIPGQYDIILIGVKENKYLSRLLTFLYKNHISNVCVIRLFTLEKQEDFLFAPEHGNLFDSRCVDIMPESFEKPYLVHLETHVCDHCNLNCKACNNFSPFIKEPAYTDIVQFEKDLKNLKRLFSGVGRFFLLGGEPLLAPELCCEMICMYRKYFPTNELRVLTNATLILGMKDEFWKCLRENDVVIHISLYPPVKVRISEIEQRLKEVNVKHLVHHEVVGFLRHWTLFPFENDEINNDKCGSAGCHYLQNGVVSKCPDAMLISKMAPKLKMHEMQLKSFDGICLEKIQDGWEIICRLDEPIDMCKKCSFERVEMVDWEQCGSDVQTSDWLLRNRLEFECELHKKELCEAKEVKIEDEKMIAKLEKQITQVSKELEIREAVISENQKAYLNLKHRNSELGKQYDSERGKNKALNDKVKEMNEDYQNITEEVIRIKNSVSYKLGRRCTYLPRKIRECFKHKND